MKRKGAATTTAARRGKKNKIEGPNSKKSKDWFLNTVVAFAVDGADKPEWLDTSLCNKYSSIVKRKRFLLEQLSEKINLLDCMLLNGSSQVLVVQNLMPMSSLMLSTLLVNCGRRRKKKRRIKCLCLRLCSEQ